MSYIILENVSKKIKNNLVLSNINLTLEKGKIYGFVGENGSGKTMLLRTVAGLLKPDGKVEVNGIDIYKSKSRETVGIMIENIGLFNELTAKENLRLLNSFSNKKISDKEIDMAISSVGLDADSSLIYKKFSLGMKQKLCIAQAIMSHPDILLLDEPTNALDENGVNMFRDIIKKENENGATVIIASHNKEDISLLCDKVYRIKNGTIEDSKND
ncbi:MAG: ATP-binding cassette domain-containing protein [Eubacteriales bacterium]|nr:ATP-binding cassette domain-containing protein [Eubacteriales bacterium]